MSNWPPQLADVAEVVPAETGGVDHGKFRPQLMDPVHGFRPAHARHHHVHEEEVDGGAVFDEQADGLLAVGCGEHGESGPGQQPRGELANCVLVLGVEDGASPRLAPGDFVVRSRLRRRGGFKWKKDKKAAAYSGHRLDADGAAVLFDDAADDRQPEAGAAFLGLGREEGFEDGGACRTPDC